MDVTFLSTSYSRFRGDDTNVPWLEDLAKGLIKKGINVKVIAPHGKNTKDKEIMDGVEVHRFKYWFTTDKQRVAYGSGGIPANLGTLISKLQFPFFIFFFALKAIRIVGPRDIIHAHWSLSGLIGIMVKSLRSNKVYLSIRGSGLRLTPRFLMKFIVDNVDLLNVDTNEYIEEIKSLKTSTEISEVRIKYINLEKYDHKMFNQKIIDEFGLKDRLVVTVVSYFVPQKCIDSLIKVIPKVLEESQRDIVFLFVGDGPLFDDYRNMVNKMKISDSVIFAGLRKDVNQILSVSDIFVRTGKESICFSNAVLEAMAMGVPCTLPNIANTTDYWTNEFDSIIYELTDDSLKGAIVKLINDKNLRIEISKNGLSFFERIGFTKEKVLEGHIENYSSLS